jgi:hypothetical protein
VFHQGEAFRQGDARLALIERGVVKVPLQPAVLHPDGLTLASVLANSSLFRRTRFGRFKLDRLASVVGDHNDSGMWIDLAERDGVAQLRLLFPVRRALDDREQAVLSVLRDVVVEKHLAVDLATREILGLRHA